ncbi:proton-coupled zinc antiporter SLC30A1-like [Uloborus diversus]|uniref:proton-coupled zinc antiporter SLC30A1-like n=1 Tax=Uloborus diversus TaxID=327109 RepID=UPI00240A197D|nr:proton-coupled zinc antiporter SLC30A1-like [Uloborus diversus]
MRAPSLYVLISLSGMVFGAEIVASHITQSLVLLISAYHMLYNILSLLLLVVSQRMSKGKTLKNTFGWARVKVLGLLVNMLFLVALCFAASVEAVQTMVHASHEDTEPRYPLLMVVLGMVNLALNIVCFVLIGGYTHHQGCSMIIQGHDVQMNCVITESSSASTSNAKTIQSTDRLAKKHRCCFGDHQVLDFSRDISSCLTVIACGAIVLLLDGLILKYADAILALASVVVLLSTTYPFIRESGLILLQSIPSHIDVEGLTKRLQVEFPDVLNVHDLHVWRLTTSEVIATVHIILNSPDIYRRIENTLKDFFLRESISSVTVQPEFTNGSWSEKSKLECFLQCSSNNNCDALTCCGPLTEKSKTRHRCTDSQNSEGGKGTMGHIERDLNCIPGMYDFAKIPTATETVV